MVLLGRDRNFGMKKGGFTREMLRKSHIHYGGKVISLVAEHRLI